MRRDGQRSKVYNAERVVRAEMNKASRNAGLDLSTVRLLERYIDGVLKRKRVHDKYRAALRPIRVKDGRGRRNACGGHGEVSLPLWSRNEGVVLHEVAHCLAGAAAWHNWEFCECFLHLVRQVMGVKSHDILKASFRKHGVQFTRPRPKREVSPERKAELAEHLAANRPTYTKGRFKIRIEPEPGNPDSNEWWVRRTSSHFGAEAVWESDRANGTIWTTREGVERFVAKHCKSTRITIVDLDADDEWVPIPVHVNPLQLMGDLAL